MDAAIAPDSFIFKKGQFIALAVDIFFSTYLGLCAIFGDSKEYSKADPFSLVNSFLYFVMLPIIVLKLIALTCFRDNKWVKCNILCTLLPQIFSTTIWCLVCIVRFFNLDGQKFTVSEFNMFFIFFGQCGNICLSFVVLPLMGVELRHRAKMASMKDSQRIEKIKALPRRHYEPTRDGQGKEASFCCICMESFDASFAYQERQDL